MHGLSSLLSVRSQRLLGGGGRLTLTDFLLQLIARVGVASHLGTVIHKRAYPRGHDVHSPMVSEQVHHHGML